jgi:hypothetical protein
MRMRALLLSLGLLFPPTATQAASGLPDRPPELRVMLVGNSLTYANNLPALLRAVGAAEGRPIGTETFAAPGGTLSERLADGAVTRALQERHFDAVVLQEQGGHLAACMSSPSAQRKAPCAASRKAYATITEQARARGAKVVLMATWGPDERWDARLARSVELHAKATGSETFHAARALQALRTAMPGVQLIPDGIHPSTQGALILALALYRNLTGEPAAAHPLRIDAPLLPINAAVSPSMPLESQPALAGDGKTTMVPVELVAPLVEALAKHSGEMLPSGRRR